MPAHAPSDHSTGRLLRAAAIATLLFSGLEMAGGRYARSLALTADAWHNLSDAAALFVTWFSSYASGRVPSHRRTFGYGRAGVLVAFGAALALLPIAGLLFYQAYRRAAAPEDPRVAVMLLLGASSLAMNLIISGALRRAATSSCPRSVTLHIAGDALASIGIVAAAILIPLTGVRALDPALAFLIACLIVWTTWETVLDSLNTLLEGLPRGMNLDEVVAAIQRVEGVEEVHDIHIWSLSPHSHALSCHVRIADLPLVEGETILNGISAALEREFEIRHTTVQLEGEACEAGERCTTPGELGD